MTRVIFSILTILSASLAFADGSTTLKCQEHVTLARMAQALVQDHGTIQSIQPTAPGTVIVHFDENHRCTIWTASNHPDTTIGYSMGAEPYDLVGQGFCVEYEEVSSQYDYYWTKNHGFLDFSGNDCKIDAVMH